MKRKLYLETLITLWIKWTSMVEIKHKDFIDVVPIIPFQNLLWTMGSRIYGKESIQILLSSPTSIDPLAYGPG